jgi:predicted Zn-dependent protease
MKYFGVCFATVLLGFVLGAGSLAAQATPAASDANASAAPSAKTSTVSADTTTLPVWHKPKHLKPEDDVSLIGHRDVGHGLNFYSLQKEIEIGRGLSDQVLRSAKVVQDPIVNEYINRLAQNLVRNSDAKVPFTVHILQDDTLNAFALPGGFFFVNSGLILALNEEDELAGAMAHEIGHVAARHATRNQTKGTLLEMATIPVMIAAGPGVGGLAAENLPSIGIPMAYMKFTRAAEAEADWLGVQYMYKTGYDPEGLVRAFEKIEELDKKKPGLMQRAFESHPQTPDRVAASQREIATILPPEPEYILTTSEFSAVRMRLARLLRKQMDEKGEPILTPPPKPAPSSPGSEKPPVMARPANDRSGSGTGAAGSGNSSDQPPVMARPPDQSGSQGSSTGSATMPPI